MSTLSEKDGKVFHPNQHEMSTQHNWCREASNRLQLFDEVLGVSCFIDIRFIGLLALHPLHLQFCSNAFVPCPFAIVDISNNNRTRNIFLRTIFYLSGLF